MLICFHIVTFKIQQNYEAILEMFLFPAKTFLSGQLIQEYSKIYHDCLCNAKTDSCMQYQKQVHLYILVP